MSFTPRNTPYSQQNLMASAAETPVWLLMLVLIIVLDRGVHGKHLAPEN